MTNPATTVQTMINENKGFQNKLKSKLESYDNVLLGQGFIVCNPHNIPLSFDSTPEENGNTLISNPETCGLLSGYSMFTKSDALKVAANVKNGAGEPAEVKHITQMLKDAIEEYEQSATWLQECLDKQTSTV